MLYGELPYKGSKPDADWKGGFTPKFVQDLPIGVESAGDITHLNKGLELRQDL